MNRSDHGVRGVDQKPRTRDESYAIPTHTHLRIGGVVEDAGQQGPLTALHRAPGRLPLAVVKERPEEFAYQNVSAATQVLWRACKDIMKRAFPPHKRDHNGTEAYLSADGMSARPTCHGEHAKTSWSEHSPHKRDRRERGSTPQQRTSACMPLQPPTRPREARRRAAARAALAQAEPSSCPPPALARHRDRLV